MRNLFCGLMLCAAISGARAQDRWQGRPEAPEPAAKPELQFLALFYTQAVSTNVFARNDFLQGQIIGRLFSENSTDTKRTEGYYAEQRLLPFFIYTPKLLGGKATLRASFEVDWTWGDQNYSTAGNSGSAISADQVNIQTQNIEVEVRPFPKWTLNVGLQRMFDTPYNPYQTLFGTLVNTGYRLAFWGTDGVGVMAQRADDRSRFKAAFYQLYENSVQRSDDVTFCELTYQRHLTPRWQQGLSFWYVRDRANGRGGVSVLGQGLTSQLTRYNGTYTFDLNNRPYRADVLWFGTYFHQNANYEQGRTLLTGFVKANTGLVRTLREGAYRNTSDILGVAANLKAGYKYGQTEQDAVSADLIFTTGDSDFDDNVYTGVMTGNTWGSPAGIYISSGSYLLFPQGNVVNRFVAAVTDISNMGYGVTGLTLNASRDLVPNRFSAKVGVAAARSNVAPVGGGQWVGTEVNATLSYRPRFLMNLDLNFAYLSLGDFYDASVVNGAAVGAADPVPATTARPIDPWIVFLGYRWLLL